MKKESDYGYLFEFFGNNIKFKITINNNETDTPHEALKQERPCAKACGMCLANCPFGAIADKAQIFQVIQAIKSEGPVYAIEVAIGADLCTIEEAEDFLE